MNKLEALEQMFTTGRGYIRIDVRLNGKPVYYDYQFHAYYVGRAENVKGTKDPAEALAKLYKLLGVTE